MVTHFMWYKFYTFWRRIFLVGDTLALSMTEIGSNRVHFMIGRNLRARLFVVLLTGEFIRGSVAPKFKILPPIVWKQFAASPNRLGTRNRSRRCHWRFGGTCEITFQTLAKYDCKPFHAFPSSLFQDPHANRAIQHVKQATSRWQLNAIVVLYFT